MVKVAKQAGRKLPVPEIIATYPGDEVTPACRQMTFES
jgi:hypothetical protein